MTKTIHRMLFLSCSHSGDRVGICSRNYPEFLVAFWACRMCLSFHCSSVPRVYPLTCLSRPHWCCVRSGKRVGVIHSFEITGFNRRIRWSPLDVLHHCLAHTQCKLIVVDSERANRLEPVAQQLAADAGTTGFLVLEAHEGKGKWNSMQTWEEALKAYKGDPQSILTTDPGIAPEDNASILFTSGVLSRWSFP